MGGVTKMSLSVEDLQTALANFEGITIEDEGDYFNVKKTYERGPSGKQTWSQINQILKDYGGEWIPNGKWSHWKVPRQQQNVKPPVDVDKGLLSEARYYLEQALDRLKQLEKK